MKTIATLFLILAFHVPSLAGKCGRYLTPDEIASSLKVANATFSIIESTERRMVTTLGTIQNSSSACIDTLVVEVKYFDAKNNLIDTVAQPLYGVVVGPTNEAAFRVRDEAAQFRDAYASQSLRITSAQSRTTERAERNSSSDSSTLVELLVSWGPMILLIAVWIFFLQRMKGKNSPQTRTLALFERQNEILEAQNALLERIAKARESSAVPGDA